jgi:alanine-glyoxylate transaminase/serine-glyoxylate transaminase/serine-pyruvate transaminase
MDRILAREEPVRSWYLDLTELQGYWGEERAYHHTAPITNVYALREALRLVAEEGIEARWDRHRHVAGGLKAGVEAMGLSLNPEEDAWLPSLNAVRLPETVDDGAVIDSLLENHGIEIASGLGALAGDVLRIGCMGHSARPGNVLALVAGLGDALDAQGADVDADAGLPAARAALSD